jgi:hypothetical protein
MTMMKEMGRKLFLAEKWNLYSDEVVLLILCLREANIEGII